MYIVSRYSVAIRQHMFFYRLMKIDIEIGFQSRDVLAYLSMVAEVRNVWNVVTECARYVRNVFRLLAKKSWLTRWTYYEQLRSGIIATETDIGDVRAIGATNDILLLLLYTDRVRV